MNNSATGQLNFMTRFTCSDDIFILGAPFSDQQHQLEPDSLIIIKVHTCHDLPSLLSSPIDNYSLCASFLFASQRPAQRERESDLVPKFQNKRKWKKVAFWVDTGHLHRVSSGRSGIYLRRPAGRKSCHLGGRGAQQIAAE
jgi:hypothetical protein